jgi:hypothetical protein
MVTFQASDMTNFYVHCAECQNKHSVEDVEFFDVEEDYVGRDIMFFVCPETQNESKSLVYKE